MSEEKLPVTVQGRFVGILILVISQIHNGVIHTVSGLGLLFAPHISSFSLPSSSFWVAFYGFTAFYGLLSLIFAYGLWMGKRWGWAGTAIISVFVIVPFSLMILWNAIRGSPNLNGVFDTIYSVLILFYLFQPHIRRTFSKTNARAFQRTEGGYWRDGRLILKVFTQMNVHHHVWKKAAIDGECSWESLSSLE